jgi:hypothetical protein
MPDTTTTRPADAAMLRAVADAFDSGEYQSSSNRDVWAVAARLDALADVLGRIGWAHVATLEVLAKSLRGGDERYYSESDEIRLRQIIAALKPIVTYPRA